MPTYDRKTDRSTTSGATPLPLAALDPAASRPEGVEGDFHGHIDARVFARSASGSAYLSKRANIRRINGTLSRVGSTLDLLAPAVDVVLTGASAVIEVSGNSVRVAVTGLAATSITWDVDVESRIYHS